MADAGSSGSSPGSGRPPVTAAASVAVSIDLPMPGSPSSSVTSPNGMRLVQSQSISWRGYRRAGVRMYSLPKIAPLFGWSSKPSYMGLLSGGEQERHHVGTEGNL